jgi:hypothetical protein
MRGESARFSDAEAVAAAGNVIRRIAPEEGGGSPGLVIP